MLIYCTVIDTPEDISKFEQVYQKYHRLLFCCAMEVLKDEFHAEDALNNTLWKIAENIGKIDQIDSLKTQRFVVTIAKRQALDLYRQLKREDTVPLEGISWEPSQELPLPEDLSPLAVALLRLPEEARTALLLKFSEGYSNREISQMTGWSISKVEKLISRGKHKLKQFLQEEEIMP